jgi:predicted transcriptional regulator/transcriptional regulator with XRE-family HTH domain
VRQGDKKLFLGGRLKRLRRDLGLTQTGFAEGLGLSPSYLNHLERNQRPVTAQLLLKLAETYAIDLRAFSGEIHADEEADLHEVLSDPLFRDLSVPRHEVSDVVENAPGAAAAMTRLYRAWRDQQRRQALSDPQGRLAGAEAPLAEDPSAWVRDHIQSCRNHFPELEALGEAISDELRAPSHDFEATATRRLADRHKVQVSVMPYDVMMHWLRRYDFHRRRLLLSEELGAPSRAFSVAYQLGLIEGADAINALLDAAGPPDLPTRRLLKVSLANYLAAAMMMPYAEFHRQAEALDYDIERLADRFASSFEQVCHRLTALSRPDARGVPFFMIRLDAAGNVSKRFAGAAFAFSRIGTACPRWNLHQTFAAPGQILTQAIETEDGSRYFTVSRTVSRPRAQGAGAAETRLAIGLGCELKYASRLVYAKALALDTLAATPIGPGCNRCERQMCPQRASAPLSRTLTVDEQSRTISPLPFETHG